MSAGTANMDLLAKLNKEQAQAVALKWGPALVIAGAGSGKTTVLTRRIAWLISQLEQDAESILAVTFTNKAAKEMKHRVEQLVGADMARRLSIGTFHSICARILRREIAAYESNEGWKWNSNFVIYDETDSMNLVKACVKKLNLDDKVFVPKSVRHEISSLKNDGFTCAKYATVAKTHRENRISELFSAYQAELARNNAFDFDDLINVFTDVMRQNPSVLARQQRRFRHVLVDEFQDTNKAQYDLVTMLAPPSRDDEWEERSLMVVGDVDQSIYSWRKADFRIILGFQNDYKNCQTIKLEENYRSTGTILEIANSIIENNTERLEKVLRCNRDKGGKAQCYEAQDEIDESFYVVEELKRLNARGRKYAETCILYRTNAQSRAIEEILVRNHIPYTMVGSTKFYDRAEIKDAIAYLKLIFNGRDSISFNRVINVPRRGIGKTSLERLSEFAGENDISLLEAASQADRIRDLPQKAAGALKEFALHVRSWQASAGTLAPEDNVAGEEPVKKSISVSELLQRVLRETKYLDKLAEDEKDEQAEGRIENVKELVAVAAEFDEVADEPDLDSFLTRISLVSDLDAIKTDADAVKLMTVHSAKGLEFNVVFVMGLEEGLFPHIRSLDSPTAMEEERRLMYVAVTRAADCLYLTLARKRMIMGRNAQGSNFSSTFTIPSQFLREIQPGLLSGYYPAPQAGKTASAGYESEPTGEDHFDEFASRGGFGGAKRSSGFNGGRGGGGFESKYGGNSEYGGGRTGGGGYGGNSEYGGGRTGGGGYGGGGYAGNSEYGGGRSNSGSGSGGYGGRTGSGGYGGTGQPAARGGQSSSGSPSSGGSNPPTPGYRPTNYGAPAGGARPTNYGPSGGASNSGGRPSGPPAKPRAMRPGDNAGNRTSSGENIRYQIDARPPAEPVHFERFVVGDQVMHTKFGNGKVVAVIGENDKEMYNVEFEEAGKRLLDPKFAKLVKIN